MDLHGAALPAYSAGDAQGDAGHGKKLFGRDCFMCHGQGAPVGPVTSASYLQLVSDQMLRTSIIVGRPDLGGVIMPDYRSLNLGRALSDQDITDLVAYLSSLRPVTETAQNEGKGKGSKRKMSGADREEDKGKDKTLNPTRRDWLFGVGVAVNVAAGLLLAVPLIGFVFASFVERKDPRDWISLGSFGGFRENSTRIATYRNPFTRPWDGQTADIPCWVRRVQGNQFQVFAINCTHLGCPVRWFQESGLFLCPCHGGAYYEDGARAAGPPPRGLFQYTYKVEKGELWVKGGEMPTLSNPV